MEIINNEKYYDMFKNRQRNVQEEQTQTFNQLMVIEKNGIWNFGTKLKIYFTNNKGASGQKERRKLMC